MARLKLSPDTLRVTSFTIPAGSADPLATSGGNEPGGLADASVTSCTLGPDCISQGSAGPC